MTKVAVDIGCGRRRCDGVIGIDHFPLPTVDIVADLEKGLPFLKENSVDVVYADSFLEHVEFFCWLFPCYMLKFTLRPVK